MHLRSMLQLSCRCLFADVSTRLNHLGRIKLICLYSAASAVAANVMLRSSFAAGFPLFTTQMFEVLGVQWACTLLGCLATMMIPIPFVLRAYGPLLREKSKAFQ